MHASLWSPNEERGEFPLAAWKLSRSDPPSSQVNTVLGICEFVILRTDPWMAERIKRTSKLRGKDRIIVEE